METNNGSHAVSLAGHSLPVDNVQKLASKNLEAIPHRYIRPEVKNGDQVSIHETSQIPVIDMSKLGAGNTDYQAEMSKLHQACKDWGFFQLINHGATTEIEKMKVDIADFFKLPLEEKKVYAQLPGGLEGYGQAFVFSDDQKLDWSDMLAVISLPISARNMRFWPNNPTSFRSTLEEYSRELHKICICLLELMSTNLRVDFREFADMYQECTQTLRMNYYPPCPEADKVLGVTQHTDGDLLTLLVQVNEVEGLQIRKDGKWISVKPLPGAIIVNIGDITEIMSNGEYRSIEHRAVVDPQKERISIAAFHNPSVAANISPLSDLVRKSGTKYKTVNYGDYVRVALGNKLDGKSLIENLKISS